MKIEIKQLTDREHILKRPSMYIGSIATEPSSEFIYSSNELTTKQVTYNAGLLKIINEIIDNSVDIITKSAKGDTVEIAITDDWGSVPTVTVSDNSIGFNTIDDIKLALGSARAGSNFDESIGQIGTNGVGAFCTNCFSKKFTCESNTFKVTWTDNAEHLTEEKIKKITGTTVTFEPDLALFGTDTFNDIQEVLKTRLFFLAYAFKNITFTLNGETLKPVSLEEVFGATDIKIKTKDYEIFIIPAYDQQNFSFVNGLYIRDGGTHIDVVRNDVVKALLDMKTMAKVNRNDIVNTMQIVFVGNGFTNLKFNSQTKEKITNTTAEVRAYLGDISALINKAVKSKLLKDMIKTSAEARSVKESTKTLEKVKKQKVKSDKFLDAQNNREYLVLVEGESALGGLAPALGRDNIAYYTLKGKPLNAWNSTTQKVSGNKELSELLSIISSNGSSDMKIVIATDQDLDGFHIRGLLLGFICKYLKDFKDNVYFLSTPVKGVTKNGRLIRWSFDIEEDLKIKGNEKSQYYKGLGSWDRDELKHVILTEGLDNLLMQVDIKDEVQDLEQWLGVDSSHRKQYILDNDFSIAKI